MENILQWSKIFIHLLNKLFVCGCFILLSSCLQFLWLLPENKYLWIHASCLSTISALATFSLLMKFWQRFLFAFSSARTTNTCWLTSIWLLWAKAWLATAMSILCCDNVGRLNYLSNQPSNRLSIYWVGAETISHDIISGRSNYV